MNVFVLIKSCAKNRDRRDAQRESWVRFLPVGWDHAFIAGDMLKTDEPDVIGLLAPDDKRNISVKVYRALQLLLTPGWKYYERFFICDDDTFVHVARLVNCGWDREDFNCAGNIRQAHESNGWTPYPQGSAFWLSRFAAREFVRRKEFATVEATRTWGIGDDLAIGRALLGRCEMIHDARYTDSVPAKIFPSSRNDLITAHKCSIKDLRRLTKENHNNEYDTRNTDSEA